MVLKICEFCGKEINAKTEAKRFCDDFCQRKHYYRRPEINKKINAYTKLYQQTPEFKEKNRKRIKIYRQRPEVKEENRILAVTKYREERRKFWKDYGTRPEVRARINANRRLRFKTNKDFAIADRLRRSFNHAMNKYSKTGKIMSSRKYGLNWKELIDSLKPFPDNLEKFEIDHIIPLHTFDLTNPEEIKKAFAPTNLRWLTIEENRKKGGKIIF
ncbi:MAG: HNH endonuclease signature motif containing protein [Nanoarchaeota archaeon]